MNSTALSEVDIKLGRVRHLLAASGLDGVLLTTQTNVSWILGGREHWVSRSLQRGFAWAYVSGDSFLVLALENELARLRDELEVEALGARLVGAPWSRPLATLAREVAGACVITDADGPGVLAPAVIQRLRLALTVDERARLAALGADVCEAVETTLLDLRAHELVELTERELAARVVLALERRGIVPAGIMVGGSDRRRRFRHPVVTDAPLGRDALVVAVGVRGGLNVALSRTVSAGPDPVLLERHALACRVDAAMIVATRPGVSWTGALEAGLAAYRDGGFPDEWLAHTQGGPIGYAPREFIALPRDAAIDEAGIELMEPDVLEHQAFAWNPTVLGAKSEDTFLVEAGGAVALTTSDRWPAQRVDVGGQLFERPAVLEL